MCVCIYIGIYIYVCMCMCVCVCITCRPDSSVRIVTRYGLDGPGIFEYFPKICRGIQVALNPTRIQQNDDMLWI